MRLAVFLLAAITTAAFAQDSVVLDRTLVNLDSNTVVLEKIDSTPNVVDLVVPVPTTVERCEPGYSRTVTRTDGYRCGYDLVTTPCHGRRYGGGYPHPGRYNPYPGRRYNPPRRHPRGRYTPRGPRRGRVAVRVNPYPPACIPSTRRVPRTCSFTVCDRPYVETVTKMKKFSVTFEDYNRDEDFEFSLDQNGNVRLIPMQTSPGCTSLVVYGDKPHVTGAKISIKSGWFNRGCR